jgi:hypothetical protein
MELPNKFSFRLKVSPGFTHSAKVDGDMVEVKWARGWVNEINKVPWTEVSKGGVELWVQTGSWIIVEDGKKPSKYPDVFHFINTIGGNDKLTMTRDGDEWRCWHYGNIGQSGCGARYNESVISNRFDGGWWTPYEPEHPANPLEVKLKNPDGFYFLNTRHDKVYAKWNGKEFDFNYVYKDTKGVIDYTTMYEWVNAGRYKFYEPKPLTAEQILRNKEINEMLAQLDSSIKIAEQNIEHHNRLIQSYEERKEVLKKGLVEE